MFLCYQLSVGGRKVAFVVEIFLQAVFEQSLLGCFLVIEVGMLWREALVLGIIILGDTEFATHTEVICSKPFGDEVVGKAETLSLVVVVEMRIPEWV